MRVGIVDDEPVARRTLRRLLARESDVRIVVEADSATAARDAFSAARCDVAFLDVQMPGGDGFRVVRELPPDRVPLVVFVTAYDHYAVRAFDAHAIDYLLKPFDDDRFRTTLRRIRERLGARDWRTREARLAAAERALAGGTGLDGATSRIEVRDARETLWLDAVDIEWVAAEDYYARIHTATRSFLIRESLTRLEARLSRSRFVRIHRSALVRVDAIAALRRVDSGETVAVLRDGTAVRVSRYRLEQVRERISSS